MHIQQPLSAPFDGFGLVFEESRWTDTLFQFPNGCLHEVLRGVVLFKQGRSDPIDLFIRTLRGQYGGNEKLKGCSILQGRFLLTV